MTLHQKPSPFSGMRQIVITLSIGTPMFMLSGCKDPAEGDLDRCIALEAKEDWAGAVGACANAARLDPDSNAGQLASSKAALLREKVAAKEAWEQLHGLTSDGQPLPPNAEARRAAATLRTFWPIASRVGTANFQLAECQDTAKGYAAFKDCVAAATAGIARENVSSRRQPSRSAVAPRRSLRQSPSMSRPMRNGLLHSMAGLKRTARL